MELSYVRFRDSNVSPVGAGQASSFLASDRATKLYATADCQLVAVMRILSETDRRAEYTIVPVNNLAFFRVAASPFDAKPIAKPKEVRT